MRNSCATRARAANDPLAQSALWAKQVPLHKFPRQWAVEDAPSTLIQCLQPSLLLRLVESLDFLGGEHAVENQDLVEPSLEVRRAWSKASDLQCLSDFSDFRY